MFGWFAGGLLTATLLLFVLMGVPAGYFGSLAYKTLRVREIHDERAVIEWSRGVDDLL